MSVHTNSGTAGAELLGYRIEGPIGQGGMGVVYRAYDVRLKRTVALKVMAPQLAADERFRDRFARESELAMALEHPNVVPIYDAGEADGRLFLAMRYVEGTDLRTLLRDEGPLDPADAVKIVTQIGNALDAAHARGLVHRDVKPSNVLLDREGHAYLADFGLTRRLAEEGLQLGDGRSLGTPAYLAPEQIEGRPLDGRADVYSLACMLYECLTGLAPFVRDSRLAMVWAHLEEEPPKASEPNPGLPDAIDAVIEKGMAKEPDGRYESCAELAAAADEALGLRPARSSARRVLSLTATAILIAVALVVAGLVAQGDDEQAAAAPVVRPNSLVRVDPKTNAIRAVIKVGEGPEATAVGGHRVWVYNWLDDTVSEIDPETNSVTHTTPVSAEPSEIDLLAGPFFAADSDGAWLVGRAEGGNYLLTRVLAGGKGKRDYRLSQYPAAVVAREGAIWVLTTNSQPNHVLRVDPATGAVTKRIPIAVRSADGMEIASGAAWVMDSEQAQLYRVDLHTGRTRGRDLGDVATPPVAGFGWIWMCVANPGSSMLRIDTRTLRTTFAIHSLPAEGGRFAVGYGSLWRHDTPTGNVMRFDPGSGKISATLHVSPDPVVTPTGGSPTSVAVGAGSVWITVT